MTIIILLLLAYLLGSIPFGLILTRMAGLGDVRNIGSGNIGATNVLRTGNKKLAALVLLLDMAKGYVAMVLALHFAFTSGGSFFVYLLTPFAVTAGHCYPIWLKFKGGKGVATALGAILGFVYPFLGLMLIVTWLIVFAIWRISSLAALATFSVLPCIGSFYFHVPLITTLPLSLLIFWRHRSNIKRLLAGTEPKFGKKTA